MRCVCVAFSPAPPATMVSKQPEAVDKKPRPVFLSAAFSRMMRQPIRKRLRTAAKLSSFLVNELSWWLTQGLWHVPPTLQMANRKTVITVYQGIATPALHRYDPLVNTKDKPDTTPVVLYVHGGAWGTGDALHYSQIACKIADTSNTEVYVLSYRLYPTVGMNRQVEDVIASMRFLRKTHSSRKLLLLAHSSGAQICALALLKGVSTVEKPLVDVAFLTAGPFHLMHHYLFEARRGVAEVSPMLPAACADKKLDNFDNCSPTVIAEHMEEMLTECALPPPPIALEGHIFASNVPLPERNVAEGEGTEFPRMYIATSSCDSIVPMYSSLRFAAALRKLGASMELLVYDGVEHIQFVTDWFRGAASTDSTGFLDVDEQDGKRRASCVRQLVGNEHAKLVHDDFAKESESAHVRDVLRIIDSLGKRYMNGHSDV